MTAVLLKFDENLSQKANKSSLAHTLKQFENEYIKKEDQITGMNNLKVNLQNLIKAGFKSINDDFEQYRYKIVNLIEESIDSQIESKFKRYD